MYLPCVWLELFSEITISYTESTISFTEITMSRHMKLPWALKSEKGNYP